MSQSVTVGSSLTYRRRRAVVLAVAALILALVIAFPPGGRMLMNFGAVFVAIAGVAVIAMLPKAYAKFAPLVRKHTR